MQGLAAGWHSLCMEVRRGAYRTHCCTVPVIFFISHPTSQHMLCGPYSTSCSCSFLLLYDGPKWPHMKTFGHFYTHP